MPRRRHNRELDVVGAALFVRLGDGFVAIAPAGLPGSPTRFYRGGPPAPASGVPLHNVSPAEHLGDLARRFRLPCRASA